MRLKAELERLEFADESRRKLVELRDANAATTEGQWRRLGRSLNRGVRKIVEETGVTEARALSELAAGLNTPVANLAPHLKRHKQELNERLRARRDVKAIRLYFLGYSNAEIGHALNPPLRERTVSRIISNHAALRRGLNRYKQIVLDATPPAPLSATGQPALPACSEAKLFRGISPSRQRYLDALGRRLHRRLRETKLSAAARYRRIKELAADEGIHPTLAETVISQHIRRTQAYLKSRRLQSIAAYRANGLLKGEIAEKIGVSPATFRKLSDELDRGSHSSMKDGTDD